MKSLILVSLLLLPLAAQADKRCAQSQPRNLQLDLAGVKTVIFDVGASDLDLHAIGSGDIDLADARGNLTVRSKGSGKIAHSGVTGRVELPRGN